MVLDVGGAEVWSTSILVIIRCISETGPAYTHDTVAVVQEVMLEIVLKKRKGVDDVGALLVVGDPDGLRVPEEVSVGAVSVEGLDEDEGDAVSVSVSVAERLIERIVPGNETVV